LYEIEKEYTFCEKDARLVISGGIKAIVLQRLDFLLLSRLRKWLKVTRMCVITLKADLVHLDLPKSGLSNM
jgi:hypothetical protein